MNTNLPSNIPGRARLLTGAAIVLATLLVTPARATVRWETLEAHEVGFRQSPQYQQWKKLLHHFYDPFPTVSHYRRVF